VPDRLFGILRHEALELGLRVLLLEVGPRVRRNTPENSAHAFEELDPHRLDAGPRGFDAEEARGLANAASSHER
jgi:hypothetical protein